MRCGFVKPSRNTAVDEPSTFFPVFPPWGDVDSSIYHLPERGSVTKYGLLVLPSAWHLAQPNVKAARRIPLKPARRGFISPDVCHGCALVLRKPECTSSRRGIWSATQVVGLLATAGGCLLHLHGMMLLLKAKLADAQLPNRACGGHHNICKHHQLSGRACHIVADLTCVCL